MPILVLFLANCSPMKRIRSDGQRQVNETERKFVERQQQLSDSCRTVLKKDSQWLEGQKEIRAEAGSGEDFVVLLREYDTDKPIEEKTGKPPLKREALKIKRKVELQKRELTDKNSNYRQQYGFQQTQRNELENKFLQQQNRQHNEMVVQADLREKRGLNVFQKGLCGLGIVLLLGVLLRRGYKRRKL